MLPRIKSLILALMLMVTASASIEAQRGGPPPAFTTERLVVRAMAGLHSAQMTYRATSGAGSFGSLAQLRIAGLIDDALASGTKYGYLFVVTPNQGTFTTTAVPVHYRKSGRYSYYIDHQGILLGADRKGQPTGPADGVYIDTCAFWGIEDNERCTIAAMRTLHSAEMTYAATVGNGQYGLLPQLSTAGLIHPVLGIGAAHGYYFQINVSSGPPASFGIWAKPQQYGVTGRRSFYIDLTGVLRGADHGGADSGPNDPPVN